MWEVFTTHFEAVELYKFLKKEKALQWTCFITQRSFCSDFSTFCSAFTKLTPTQLLHPYSTAMATTGFLNLEQNCQASEKIYEASLALHQQHQKLTKCVDRKLLIDKM